jgi:hypothetical protein
MIDQPRDFISPRGQKDYAIKLAGEALAHLAGHLAQGTQFTLLMRPPWANDDGDHRDVILLTTDKLAVVIEALKASEAMPITNFELVPDDRPRPRSARIERGGGLTDEPSD